MVHSRWSPSILVDLLYLNFSSIENLVWQKILQIVKDFAVNKLITYL